MRRSAVLFCSLLLALPAVAAPPSIPSADAPALAALGPFSAGTRTLTIAAGSRHLRTVLWYPARAPAGAQGSPYRHRLEPPPPLSPLEVSTEALAIADAAAAAGRFPLVVISHGYRGWPGSISYLAENLATKGYVVAGIDHQDLAYRDAAGFQRSFAQTALTRARDQQAVIAFLTRVTADLPIDPERVALVGYSMGGFGALATAGAGYDPASPAIRSLPPGALDDQLEGRRAADPRLKALVVIAPWGAQAPHRVWSADGLKRLTVPMLAIAGSEDDVSGYRDGVARLFGAATSAERYLLTYRDARHNVGGNPSPPEARAAFGYREMFDEPVWRHDRLNAINQHFITAFLDRHLKGDESRAANLRAPYAGFQPRWSIGFDLEAAAAQGR